MLKNWVRKMKAGDAERNERRQAMRRERDAAASAIAWPMNTLWLVNPDPAQRRAVNRMIVVGCSLVVALFFAPDIAKDITKSIKAHEAQSLRPAMELQLQSGNALAAVWLATHYPKDHPGLLQKEVEAGEPTAMFIMGRALMLNPAAFKLESALSDRQAEAKGLDLVRRAARAGNLDAMTFAMAHGGL